MTLNAPSGGAVRPPALRQPSEIKNSFVQWTKEFSWQREKDSNPHIRSQSPLCYLYTIPLGADSIIHVFRRLSRVIFKEVKACSRPLANSLMRPYIRSPAGMRGVARGIGRAPLF